MQIPRVHSEALGSAAFRSTYGVKYAYASGSMYKGIASKEVVIAMGRAGLMGFLGTGGLSLDTIDSNLAAIQSVLQPGQAYGANVLASIAHPEHEAALIDLYLRRGVRVVEAAAFMQMSAELVRFRLTGLHRDDQGAVVPVRHVIAKISHPDVAALFMRPPARSIVEKLRASGRITPQEAELAAFIPVASDICVEADSGGHTDQGVAYVLMPAMLALRDEVMRECRYTTPLRIGAAGGIGTPQAAAAAFVMGADFIVTGSVNQCTVEAGTSDAVKDLLQDMNVQDTDYAPAGDMFETGARVQVLKKGLFFPARANKLYELFMRYDSLDDIDEKMRNQIQDRYFKRSFAAVWDETRKHYERTAPMALAGIEANPKRKMALTFRWYFVHSTRLALAGSAEQRVDYQIQCGPALGAFNQWVKGTEIEGWRSRRVADIAERIMQGAADVLTKRLAALCTPARSA